MGRRSKNSWNDATKKMIVAESNVKGVSAASVARRYKISAQQLALWRQDNRFNGSGEASGFYPVEVTPELDIPILPSNSPHILFPCGTKIICLDEAALVLAVRAVRQVSPDAYSLVDALNSNELSDYGWAFYLETDDETNALVWDRMQDELNQMYFPIGNNCGDAVHASLRDGKIPFPNKVNPKNTLDFMFNNPNWTNISSQINSRHKNKDLQNVVDRFLEE